MSELSFVIQRVTGRQISLSEIRTAVLRIGRGTNAELRSDNPAVALEHAVIESDSAGYSVVDKGSITGTYVNGKPVETARLALERSRNPQVRAFAETMVRDHEAVNGKALALVKKLNVTPAPNATSAALSGQAEATMKRLATLDGAAFDRAYAANEAAYHATVNGALVGTLVRRGDGVRGGPGRPRADCRARCSPDRRHAAS